MNPSLRKPQCRKIGVDENIVYSPHYIPAEALAKSRTFVIRILCYFLLESCKEREMPHIDSSARRENNYCPQNRIPPVVDRWAPLHDKSPDTWFTHSEFNSGGAAGKCIERWKQLNMLRWLTRVLWRMNVSTRKRMAPAKVCDHTGPSQLPTTIQSPVQVFQYTSIQQHQNGLTRSFGFNVGWRRTIEENVILRFLNDIGKTQWTTWSMYDVPNRFSSPMTVARSGNT